MPDNAAQVIAANLACLPHPDGGTRQLAAYSTALLPEPMAAEVTKTAGEIGEAIVHLLETAGWQIIPAGAAPAPPTQDTGSPIGQVWCNVCDAPMLQLNLSDPSRIMASGPMLCEAFGADGCKFPKCGRR